MRVRFFIARWEQGEIEISDSKYEEYLAMDTYDKMQFVEDLAYSTYSDKDTVEAYINPIKEID